MPGVVFREESKTGVGFKIGLQIFWVQFCIIHLTSFFKITFQITSEQKWTQKIWIRLVKYSCAKISDLSEVPRLGGNLIF